MFFHALDAISIDNKLSTPWAQPMENFGILPHVLG
jgi:hypothetical protein